MAALSAMALVSIAPQKQVALFKAHEEEPPAKIVITFKDKPEDLYEATQALFETLNLELPGGGAEPKVEIGADAETIRRIGRALQKYTEEIEQAGGNLPVTCEIATGEFIFHPAEPEGPLPPEDDPRELAYRLGSARQYLKTIVKATTALQRQQLFSLIYESLLENREAAERVKDSKLVALIDAVTEEVRKLRGKS